MRHLKRPNSKRQDDTIVREQEAFTNMFRDVPASELPDGGVADARNMLLYGSHAKVRWGIDQMNGITMPFEKSFTGLSKTLNIVTKTGGDNFTADDVGSVITTGEGSTNVIIEFNNENEVLVDDGLAWTTIGEGELRRPINSMFFHKKARRILLHMGNKVYWTDNKFWNWYEISNPSAIDPYQSKSSFDEYEDHAFLFSSNGIFKIDLSDPKEPFMIMINTTNVKAYQVPEERLDNPDFPKSNTESEINRTGRRYLVSMSRLTNVSVPKDIIAAPDQIEFQKLIDTTKNFAASGFAIGDTVYNQTQATSTTVTGISTTYNINDTLELDTDIFPFNGPAVFTGNSWAIESFAYINKGTGDMRAAGVVIGDIIHSDFSGLDAIITGISTVFLDNGAITNLATNKLIDTAVDFTTITPSPVAAGWIVENTVTGVTANVTGVSTTTNPNDTLDLDADIFSIPGEAYGLAETINNKATLTRNAFPGPLFGVGQNATIYHSDTYRLVSESSSYAERGKEGVAIEKETGTNPGLPENNYTPYIQSWGAINPNGEASGVTRISERLQVGAPFNDMADLQDWVSSDLTSRLRVGVVDNVGTRATVTENVEVILRGAISFTEVADLITNKIRGTFIEYPYITLLWDVGAKRFLFHSGEVGVTVSFHDPFTGSGTPGTSYQDISGTSNPAYLDMDNMTDFEIQKGMTVDEAREAGLGWLWPGVERDRGPLQEQWTHYSIYSTESIGRDFTLGSGSFIDSKDESIYIWNGDIPIIKMFKGECASATDDRTVTGTATSTDVLLVDTSNNFLNPGILQPGDVVDNLTTLQSTTIDDIIDENTITTIGGILFNEGDEYEITPTGLPNKTHLILNEGNFENYDLGSFVNFNPGLPTETRNRIIEIISPTEAVLEKPDTFSNTLCGIGVKDNFYEGTSTLSGIVTGIPEIALGDVLFWADGAITTVTRYENGNFYHNNKVLRTSMPVGRGADVDDKGRNFNDTISDEILQSRLQAGGNFLLTSQNYTALPHGRLGMVKTSWLLVGEIDGTSGHYCFFEPGTLYLAGHHEADLQFFVLKDKMMHIGELTDLAAVYCRGSTWGANTNVPISETNESTGLDTPILSGMTIIDGAIGARDQKSVIPYGTGRSIVITSEPGIRVFDGFQYGENLIMDDAGRGHIRRALQQMRGQFCGVYDPSFYGLMFWGTNNTQYFDDHPDTIAQNPDMVRTTESYRLAIEKQQGFGFSELYGDNWAFPDLGGPPMMVEYENGISVLIHFGFRGTPYLIRTKEFNSDELEQLAYDGYQYYYDLGNKIPWQIVFKEHTSSEENHKLRHMEGFFYSRPETENVYQDGLFIQAKAWIDNERQTPNPDFDTAPPMVSTVLPGATINMPQVVEGKRIQFSLEGEGSQFTLVKYRHLFDVLNRRQAPNLVVDQDAFQDQFANGVLWLTRAAQLYRNRYTGTDPASIPTITPHTGPDSNPGSAFNFSTIASYAVAPMSSDRGFHFAVQRSGIANGTILREVNTANPSSWFEIYVVDDELVFNHGGVTFHILPLTDLKWYYIFLGKPDTGTATHSLQYTSTYTNSSPDMTFTTVNVGVLNPLPFTGTIEIGPMGSNTRVHDLRVIDTTISNRMIEYTANDILTKRGFSLLPALGVE